MKIVIVKKAIERTRKKNRNFFRATIIQSLSIRNNRPFQKYKKIANKEAKKKKKRKESLKVFRKNKMARNAENIYRR